MDDKYAFSISGFCHAHNVSRATFYNLVKSGKAPRLFKVGQKVLISKEAAADWRNACEAETAKSTRVSTKRAGARRHGP